MRTVDTLNTFPTGSGADFEASDFSELFRQKKNTFWGADSNQDRFPDQGGNAGYDSDSALYSSEYGSRETGQGNDALDRYSSSSSLYYPSDAEADYAESIDPLFYGPSQSYLGTPQPYAQGYQASYQPLYSPAPVWINVNGQLVPYAPVTVSYAMPYGESSFPPAFPQSYIPWGLQPDPYLFDYGYETSGYGAGGDFYDDSNMYYDDGRETYDYDLSMPEPGPSQRPWDDPITIVPDDQEPSAPAPEQEAKPESEPEPAPEPEEKSPEKWTSVDFKEKLKEFVSLIAAEKNENLKGLDDPEVYEKYRDLLLSNLYHWKRVDPSTSNEELVDKALEAIKGNVSDALVEHYQGTDFLDGEDFKFEDIFTFGTKVDDRPEIVRIWTGYVGGEGKEDARGIANDALQLYLEDPL